MDELKVLRFPYQKKIHNKGHLNLAKDSEGFSPYVINALCETHSKSNKHENE